MDGNGISSIIACVTTKVWLRNLLGFVGIRSALGYFALNMIGGLRHTVFFPVANARTYRQAVELLAEPRQQVPYDHICRLLCVSEHTLKAIEKARIAFNCGAKTKAVGQALRIASKAAERVEDQSTARTLPRPL